MAPRGVWERDCNWQFLKKFFLRSRVILKIAFKVLDLPVAFINLPSNVSKQAYTKQKEKKEKEKDKKD